MSGFVGSRAIRAIRFERSGFYRWMDYRVIKRKGERRMKKRFEIPFEIPTSSADGEGDEYSPMFALEDKIRKRKRRATAGDGEGLERSSSIHFRVW